MAGPITVQPFGAGTIDGIVKINIFASGGNLFNPMTSLGDMIYGGINGNLNRLAIGSNTQILTVTGGLPSWQTISYQPPITLTTTGDNGASTFVSNTLNIPIYTLSGLGGQPQLNGIGFVKISGTTISYDNSTYLTSYTEIDPVVKAINGIVKSNGTTISAAIAGTDYQAPITLTTTGTSGAATFVSNVLNIPNYSSGGLPGGVTNDLQKNSGSNTFSGTGILSPSPAVLDATAAGVRLTIRNDNNGIQFATSSSDIILQNNTAFFGTGSYGGGSFVMFIANRSVAPSSNPSAGGILYAESGSLKWRGSSGTVTTIAPA